MLTVLSSPEIASYEPGGRAGCLSTLNAILRRLPLSRLWRSDGCGIGGG
jgi:hypothetical protein